MYRCTVLLRERYIVSLLYVHRNKFEQIIRRVCICLHMFPQNTSINPLQFFVKIVISIVFYNHIILQIIAIYMIIIRKPYCFNFHDISETNSILLYFCGRNYFEPQRVNKIFLRVLGNRKFIRRKRDDTRLTSINITAR